MRAGLVGAAAALALALAGARAAAAQRFPLLAAAAPAGEGAVAPCTVPGVEGAVRCGVFRVHEDREAAAGRTLDLHFVVLPALDAARRAPDAVTYFLGGPGAATLDATAGIARDVADLRRRRDVLLVDLRGIGRSAPLDCDVPYPGGLRSRFGTIFPLDHVAACRAALAPRARLDRYTTAASVDDVEALRRWLGYDALNLIGGSYGTRVAQLYLRRHPRAVRTVVMNGVTPVWTPGYVQAAPYLQRALGLLVAECEAERACARDHPRFRRDLDALLARLRAAPATVEVDGARVPFGAGDLAYALRGLLYARARHVPALVGAAAGGDLAPLARYYLERTAWMGAPGGALGNHLSVLCAEDVAPLTDADVARASRGTFLGDHLIASYRAACAAWPHARLPASHFTPVASDVPTLLLSGERDPVTPPAGAEAVARHLTRAVHVVVPGAGHGVGGPCVDAKIRRLIEDGDLRRVTAGC